MPFDGRNFRQSILPRELYQEMLDRYEGGRRWTQCVLQCGPSYCLVGMAYKIRYGGVYHSGERLQFNKAFANDLGFTSISEVMRWNDEYARQWSEVEGRLKEAMNNAV